MSVLFYWQPFNLQGQLIFAPTKDILSDNDISKFTWKNNQTQTAECKSLQLKKQIETSERAFSLFEHKTQMFILLEILIIS